MLACKLSTLFLLQSLLILKRHLRIQNAAKICDIRFDIQCNYQYKYTCMRDFLLPCKPWDQENGVKRIKTKCPPNNMIEQFDATHSTKSCLIFWLNWLL